MTIPQAQDLIRDYAGNTWLIKRHTEQLTHEESMLQPPFPANCLNWVLGHIISRRNSALELLNHDPTWDHETETLYRSGSPPLTDANAARPFPLLLQDLDETQERIEAALGTVSEEHMGRVVETDRGARPVGEHLAGLHWHETYHLGQLDILRAMILAARNEQENVD